MSPAPGWPWSPAACAPSWPAERTALNFAQHLSGIATLTRRYVDLIAGLPCQLLDTRKTTPGWRMLEKYAVRCGGGVNHRMGLGDGILIKDNHLASLGDPGQRQRRGRPPRPAKHASRCPIEVEVDTLDSWSMALASVPTSSCWTTCRWPASRDAVRRRNAVNPRILLEASGGVNLGTATRHRRDRR